MEREAAPLPPGHDEGGGLLMVLVVGFITVAAYMPSWTLPQDRRLPRVPQEWLDDRLLQASNFMSEWREHIALGCLLALGALHVTLAGFVWIDDERGLVFVYHCLTGSWLGRRYGGFFFGLYARQISWVARTIVRNVAARASFERYGFDDRVNISLNSLHRDSNELQLRTLDELGLEKVLPDPGARQLYKIALQWTDVPDEKPAQFDPFVSLSSSGRVGPIPKSPTTAVGDEMHEKGKRARQYHGMIVDQLTNLISAPYAIGHIGKDLRLQYMTREYVWGVTMERRDANGNEVPSSSLKTRILLIQKEVLERIDDYEPDASEEDDNIRDRWLRLQKLRDLWEAERQRSPDDTRCFLVGSTKITVAKPGGVLATSAVPWERYLQLDRDPSDDLLDRPSPRMRDPLLQRSSTKNSAGRSGSGGDGHSGRQLSRNASHKMKKVAVRGYRSIRWLIERHPLLFILAAMLILVCFDLLNTAWSISGSHFGQITLGAFARDIVGQVFRFLRRGKQQHAFGERGFANRLNISLNSFILDDNRGSNASEEAVAGSAESVSMELRTLADMSIDEVLPSLGARQKLESALKWTDQADNETGSKPGIHPFVSLDENLSQLGKDDEERHDGVDEKLREIWRMSCSQVDNQISAPFATGHIGADMRQNYITASYVWGLAYERPPKKTINQKIRVLLIQKSTLKEIHQCTHSNQRFFVFCNVS